MKSDPTLLPMSKNLDLMRTAPEDVIIIKQALLNHDTLLRRLFPSAADRRLLATQAHAIESYAEYQEALVRMLLRSKLQIADAEINAAKVLEITQIVKAGETARVRMERELFETLHAETKVGIQYIMKELKEMLLIPVPQIRTFQERALLTAADQLHRTLEDAMTEFRAVWKRTF